MNKLKLLLLALVFFASPTPGYPEGDEPQRSPAQLTLDDLRTFTDVFNQVRRNYVEDVDDKTLLDSAIRGMLSDLDPHSGYLPGPEYQELDDNARGRYSGIGIDVRAEDRKLLIKSVIDDSPADQAGINAGDTIISIDGVPVKGRYLPDAIDQLSGEPETQLVIRVLSPDGEERELELIRKYIKVPTLSFRLLDKSYGYFRITQFHNDSAIDLEQSLTSIRNDGIELRGIILDLRNNPGGVMHPAVSMADGFLNEGVIVSTRGRNATMQLEFKAHTGEWLPDIPLMVIVDRGTASASEVLAGALQDHGRALIIGERTFGKGSVQSILPLRNGDGIKLTTARYYTPSGRSIQAEGITPDFVIDSAPSHGSGDARVREADLERHLEKGSASDRGTNGPGNGGKPDIRVEEVLGILREAGIINGENGELPNAVGEDDT